MSSIRFLLDTNIIITREQDDVLDEDFVEFYKLSQKNNIDIRIHQETISEIERNNNPLQREKMLQKVKTYPTLDFTNFGRKFEQFLLLYNPTRIPNDVSDAKLLYCLHEDLCNFLITKDVKLKRKSKIFGLESRVITPTEAILILDRLYNIRYPKPSIDHDHVKLMNIDVNNQFFDSFRTDYPEFNGWFNKIQAEEREGYIYRSNGKIYALMITKIESEEISLSDKKLKSCKRLKINSLKVELTGYKIGERFLFYALNLAILNGCDEIYVTVFPKHDVLIYLLENYGFVNSGENERREYVFIKSLINYNSQGIIVNYPKFIISETTGGYIVPIHYKWFRRLFLGRTGLSRWFDNNYQPTKLENTVRKAYLSQSKINKLKPGDLIFFYQTKTRGRGRYSQSIVSVGIIEETFRTKNYEEIIGRVGSRIVFSDDEVKELCKKEVLVMRFLHLKSISPVPLRDLEFNGILQAPPQSIMQLKHEAFIKLLENIKLDESYIINQT